MTCHACGPTCPCPWWALPAWGELIKNQREETMTDQPMTDSELETRLTESYNLGVSSGLGDASKILLDRAALLFRAQDDKMAKYCRDLADDLKKRSNDAHPRRVS